MPDPTLSAISKKLRFMLDICSKTHRRCQVGMLTSATELPTRVIDAGPLGPDELPVGHTVRLVAFPDDRPSYVALSYCWGGVQTFQTTAKTLASNLEGISIKELPQTIVDAIKVAQCLHIRYLWIDSLTIVQDDAEDKDRGLAKMSSIYANSEVTISAAVAGTCWTGFLAPQVEGERREDESMTLPFVHRGASGGPAVDGLVNFRPARSREVDDEGKHWPTDERAWIFQ
jgi:hypothetical protein